MEIARKQFPSIKTIYIQRALPRSELAGLIFSTSTCVRDESTAMEQPYEIVSVRRAKPPLGAEGSNWQHYMIAYEGRNSIHGYRQGDLKAVTREVEEIVAKLNERHRVPTHSMRRPGRAIRMRKKNPQK